MAFKYIGVILQRILLPALLIAACLIRPVGISLVYLVMYFLLPFVPVAANSTALPGVTTAYFIISISVASLIMLAHIGLQIVVAVLGEDSIFGRCTFNSILLRHLGFINLNDLKVQAIIEWILPDVLFLLTSIILYVVLKKLARSETIDPVPASSGTNIETGSSGTTKKDEQQFQRLIKICPALCLASLFIVAALRPSVIGAFYYLIFLISGTYWGCFRKFGRGFGVLMRFVMFLLVFQIIVIISYQTPWPQEHLNADSLAARLAGLEPLILSSCKDNGDIRIISFNSKLKADSYLLPVGILLSYYILALSSKNLMEKKLVKKAASLTSEQGPPATEPTDSIKSDEKKATVAELGSMLLENILSIIQSVGNFIYQNSYIFTNIVMMAWSIIYHSWLTFVLLISANILWMIPNQRKAMLRSSPFIVLYGEILVILQYLYGMQLTDDELPSKVETKGINLKQIGLEKPDMFPGLPIFFKTVFTVMFWTTLRQFFREAKEKKQTSALADMVAPLQLTVGAAASELAPQAETKTEHTGIEKLGNYLKSLLIKLWIWLLILVIFLCGVTGKSMTGFRIFYMALFLVFVLTFQCNWKAWMRMMYGFWIFLIVYAMVILILIYTYQFDRFDEYWHTYLGITPTLQKDIGLEQYNKKGLFLHLVTPTLILIMTIVQVHSVHKKFIESLQTRRNSMMPENTKNTGLNEENDGDDHGDKKSESLENLDEGNLGKRKFHRTLSTKEKAKQKITELKSKLSEKNRKRFYKKFQDFIKDSKAFVWKFAELHLLKTVFIVAFLCCITEVCVLHITLAFMCVIGLVSKQKVQICLSRVMSVIIAIFILAKMIYQVDYIDHVKFDVHCNNNTNVSIPVNSTEPDTIRTILNDEEEEDGVLNNAKWFGFRKVLHESSLLYLIRRYLYYLILCTMHAVLVFQQDNSKKFMSMDKDDHRKSTIFPRITRKDAEEGLLKLLKYLLNYGFYKFGYEICLVMLTVLITCRHDLYAIFYAFWLCALVKLQRDRSPAIWKFFQGFTIFIIFVQYLIAVGLPPGLCIDYPWKNFDAAANLQEWAILPSEHNDSGAAYKMIFDFVLLLLLSRQSRIFKFESKIDRENISFAGGSNKSVIHEIENMESENFYNPTEDFITNVRNWLDIVKNFVLLGMFWVTLAVVFLAGTNVVNFFSLGYLIGSFTFLWQGSDFYLRPIQDILKWWYMLIHYTVAVITIKTITQLGGCLFLNALHLNACWFVHLLGITCIGHKIENTDDFEINTGCPVVLDKHGLLWDALCFTLLLFQLRVFSSYYFCHIINETKASAILASRGAVLIEDLREKQIEYKRKHEEEVLKKIKTKMEKIRATQQKMMPMDKQTHLEGAAIAQRPKPKTHGAAIRAGDYYMFADDPDEKIELDLLDDEADFLEDHGKISGAEKKITKRKTIFEDGDTAALAGEGSSRRSSRRDSKPMPEKRPDGEGPSEEEEEVDGETQGEPKEKNLIFRLVEGVLVSIAMTLHRLARNYRYVIKILKAEKQVLKESPDFGERYRAETENRKISRKGKISSSTTSSSEPSTSHIVEHKEQTDTQTKSDVDEDTVPISRQEAEATKSSAMPVITRQQMLQQQETTIEDDEFDYEDDAFETRDHNLIIEVLIALWYVILSNTDIICFTVVFVNQVASASILSLPLPIMVLLWGTLTIPRPSKTFWVTLIAYTQAVVLIKCVFQYKTIWISYRDVPNNPLSARSIIGIEPKEDYASYDLLLLLVLFFHRFVLKSMGLWKSQDPPAASSEINIIKNELCEEEAHESFQDPLQEETHSLDGSLVSSKKSHQDSIVDHEYVGLKFTDRLQNAKENVPKVIKATSAKYFSAVVEFFKDLIYKPRLPSDVYAFMFLCDFSNFFVLVFGFTAFGAQQGDGGVSTYLAENKVPIPFLIMLLLQFCLIVIDRSLYLRKALIYKIVFHFFSVFGIHIWMFFVIPAVTERNFNSLQPPVVFYLIKCFYLLLSSYQIRCGFPKRILGNIITKGYSIVHMVAFRVYKITPFLYELRTLLDWVCTETTMTVFDWLKMEDIFSEVYLLKCGREMEKMFPVVRAEKKKMLSKIIMGGTGILLIVIIIWAPLALFALSSAVGYANVPTAISITVKLGQYEPIYSVNIQDSIHVFNDDYLNVFQTQFLRNKAALAFISSYDSDDIGALEVPVSSSSVWDISPPERMKLLDDLVQNRSLIFRLSYSLTRVPPSKDSSGVISGEVPFEMSADFSERKTMINMLQGTSNPNDVISIPHMLPKFLKVKNLGDLNTAHQLTPAADDFRGITLKLSSKGTGEFWWELRENCTDHYYRDTLSKLPFANCESKTIVYTFSDKKFPSTFSFLTAGGIIGMYTTFVILISRSIRGAVTGSISKIMFEDLPYVDRILQLCLDIYLVREAMEFALEEDLFAKLLFLYRSPETMIKWTRPIEEVGDEEGEDTESIRSSRREALTGAQNE